MSRKRLSKKQLRQDRFVQQTFDWAHWAETHRNHVIAGIAVVSLNFVAHGYSTGAGAPSGGDPRSRLRSRPRC